MISTREVLETIVDAIYYSTGNIVYCICYNNGTDKRVLINYGVFWTEDECKNYIKSIKNDNLEVYPIKVNLPEEQAVLSRIHPEISHLQNILYYYSELENNIKEHIFEDANTLLSSGFTEKEVLNYIEDKYYYFKDKLYDLLPTQLKEAFKKNSHVHNNKPNFLGEWK